MMEESPDSVASSSWLSRSESASLSSLEGEQIPFVSEDGICIWAKFNGQPPIPGFLKNVVAVFRDNFHSGNELNEDDKRSVMDGVLAVDAPDREETNFTKEICKYLLNNGVEHLQVMSNFPEYVQTVSEELGEVNQELGIEVMEPEPTNELGATRVVTYDYVDVTVLLLMPCSGRWLQRKLCELVAEAYRASRLGVVILSSSCNVASDNRQDELWNEFVGILSNMENGDWKDYLEIVCRHHKLINRNIFSSQDLRTQSPFGGCTNLCGEMDCGHFCRHPCHPFDPNHVSEEFRCEKTCKRVCRFGHRCKDTCWKDCDACYFVVNLPKSCEHEAGQEMQVFCHQQSDQKCQVPVKKTLDCGHSVKAICSLDMTNHKCREMLGGLLPCGHGFAYECWENVQDFRCKLPTLKTFDCGHDIVLPCGLLTSCGDSLKCDKTCGKRLECGHFCELPCHLEDPDHKTYQCPHKCIRQCQRGFHPCKLRNKHPCNEPCPPCDELYEHSLPCAHWVTLPCTSSEDEEALFCRQPCARNYPKCGHPCNKLCGEDCGTCPQMITIIVPGCKYGHQIYMHCKDKRPTVCKAKVLPRTEPECGHVVWVACREADTVTKSDLAEMCEEACRERFDGDEECGHSCQGTCRDCYQGRFHMRCREPCGKILICGHSCTVPCGMACPPCRYPCFNVCEHDVKCEFECGVPCERKCKKPCPYECMHSRCSKRCLEVCDKPLCNEPCPKVLACGHPCVGFCGELCPPYCRTCTPDKLLEGMFSGSTEVDPEDKFIYLPDCGHCVESRDMENWLSVEFDEILPLRCPICRTRLGWIRRYSAAFHENHKLVNSVRAKIFGNVEEIKGILAGVDEKIEAHVLEAEGKHFFPEYVKYIRSELKRPLFSKPEPDAMNFVSIYIDMARFLNWIASEWINCSEILVHWSTRLSSELFDRLEKYWKEYIMEMAASRVWPMHPSEIRALERERERMDDLVTLFSRMDSTGDPRTYRLASSVEGRSLFERGEELLRQNKPYTPRRRAEFRAVLNDLGVILSCTLGISEKEREEIVVAFGAGSGRWFKCARGHVYVVTECGGATELGKCNECGGDIGGQNHVLVEENYLASEMDGAVEPLYPTVFLRPPNN